MNGVICYSCPANFKKIHELSCELFGVIDSDSFLSGSLISLELHLFWTHSLPRYFMISENSYMSLFGCFPFWTPVFQKQFALDAALIYIYIYIYININK